MHHVILSRPITHADRSHTSIICDIVARRGRDCIEVTRLDIATWLDGLGLQQYERAFRDNAIDATVLPELTAEDLKELGVNLVGHRRKLLAAIAALRSEDAPQRPTTDKVVSAAERRQITVMFCDVVDSTALSTRLDPEDLREVLDAYQKCVAETIGRYDGFVARYMGDGVLVYFGYPQAGEDDAERAVRASLAQIEAIRHLQTRERLEIRIGIGTGLVVVGGLPGVGEHKIGMSLARPPILPRGCRPWPNPTRSLSARQRGSSSVICSSTATLAPFPSRASPSQYTRTRCSGQGSWKAGSRRCIQPN